MAIKVLALNVEAYPQSSNTWDSLGEAYADDGDKQLALANYRKSVELDPKERRWEEGRLRSLAGREAGATRACLRCGLCRLFCTV